MKILVILCVIYASGLCSCGRFDEIIARFNDEVTKTKKFLEDAESTLKCAKNALEEYAEASAELQSSKRVEAENARKAFENAKKALEAASGTDEGIRALQLIMDSFHQCGGYELPSVEDQNNVIREALEKVTEVQVSLQNMKPIGELYECCCKHRLLGITPVDAKPKVVEQTTVSTSGCFGSSALFSHKYESSTNDSSCQPQTEESVLVGSDKNEETATEHEDIPHQSFSSHSEEQLQTGEETTQSEELPESAESPTEVASVEQEEQDTAPADSQPDANTETNEVEPLNETESSQEVASPSQDNEEEPETPESVEVGDAPVDVQPEEEAKPVDVDSESSEANNEPEEPKEDLGDGTDLSPLPLQQLTLVSDYKLMVDSFFFNVEEGEENGIKILRLTVKSGTSTNKLFFDGKLVWQGRDPRDACSSATFYFGESGPIAALYRFKKGGDGKAVKGYRKFSGGQWTSVNKEGLEKLLEELKQTSGMNDEDTKHVESPETPKEEIPLPDGQMGEVMDLASIYQDKCNSFDYNFAGNAVRLVVPKKDVTFTRLVDAEEEVWTPGKDEEFGYIREYLNKDGKPEFVVLIFKTLYGAVRRDYVKDEGRWTSCTNHEEKMRSLRIPATFRSAFELDLSLANSTNECSIFEAELVGVTTKHFFPKAGFHAKKVNEGTRELWTGGVNDYCRYCLIYRKGDKELLEIVVVENELIGKKYFERVYGEWKSLTRDEFDRKIEEMKRMETKQPSVDASDSTMVSHSKPLTDDKVPLESTSDKYESFAAHHLEHSPTEDTEQTTVSSSDPVDQQTTEVSELQEPEPLQSTGSHLHPDEEPEVTPSETSATETLDLSHHDDSQIDLKKGNVSGLDYNIYSPKKDVKITSVVDSGDNAIWTASGDEKCVFVESYANEDVTILCLQASENGGTTFKYFEKTGSESWNNITEGDFDRKMEEMGEAVKSNSNTPQEASSSSVKFSRENLRGSQEDVTGSSKVIKTTSYATFQEEMHVGKLVESPKATQESQQLVVTTDPNTLDISKPDKDRCNSFDYSLLGNAMKLVVPNKDVSISKLMNGSEEVWTAEEEEAFDHAEIYLNRDGRAELAVLILRTSSGLLRRDYARDENGWAVCDNSEEKMKNLKDITEWISDFNIDLSASKDTDKCSIFEVDLLGVTTRHFYPKPGHNIIEVKDGNNNLWTPVNTSDVCLFCLVYKKGDKELLEVAVTEDSSRRWKFFERVDGGWRSITEDDYDQNIKDMIGGFLGSTEDGPQDVQLHLTEDTHIENLGGSQDKEGPPVEVASDTALQEGENVDKPEIPSDNTLLQSSVQVDSTPIALDLTKPDESKVDILKVSRNEVEKKEYYPKDTSKITTVVDGEAQLWTGVGDDKCCLARSYSKGDSSFLVITIKGGNDLAAKFFEKVGGAWNEVDEEPFTDRVTTMMGELAKPVSSFLDKVDSTLFNLEDGEENGIKVLKLKAKEGTSTNKLTFDNLTVWEDSQTPCSSAVIYMNGSAPDLAVIKTKDGSDTESTVYRYYDGSKWQDGNMDEHNSKLEALKNKLKELQDAARPKESTETVGDNVEEKAKPADKPVESSTSKPSEPKGASTEAPQDSSTEDIVTNLDQSDSKPANSSLSKVNTSLFNVEEGQENGFKVLKLTPKEGVTSNKLTYGSEVVWQAQNAGDACSMAIFYLGKEGLVGALYRFKRENDGKTVEGYRQFSDGNWSQVSGAVFRKLIGKDEPVTTSKEPSTNEGAKDKPKPTSTVAPPSEESKPKEEPKATEPPKEVDTQSAEQAKDPSVDRKPDPKLTNKEAATALSSSEPEDGSLDTAELNDTSPQSTTRDEPQTDIDKKEEDEQDEYENEDQEEDDGEQDEQPQVESSSPDTISSSSPDAIDIKNATDPRYKVLDVHIDGVPSRIFSMDFSANVTNVLDREYTVWKATDPGVKCLYCIEYLKDGEPKFATVVTKKGDKLEQKNRKYKDQDKCCSCTFWRNKKCWKDCNSGFANKINALKTYTDPPTKFTLDISSPKEDDDKFKLVGEEKNGVTTHFFAARKGYGIGTIADDGKNILSLNGDLTFFLCEVHSKGDHGLMRLYFRHNGSIDYPTLEKKDGKWTEVLAPDYFMALEKMYSTDVEDSQNTDNR
ncbi:hypothetical protein BEWA_016100 [Theileria equi strain WA]|uniref:Signal peptide containing protein n=1 Tax=Theileria equi strain WA TaxID=1537102 RepID=L1LCP2_THEEQ|nr:hypothetical protein BEWA_016100 [Theileria equi strain WA]EKX73049.1 hypothetical protein BEWA_016100 [Theileria equi strain WA]|eukprot:XP_004832501.1 hypothetical protein BEWA_016100 [Theileria equi strain WA]